MGTPRRSLTFDFAGMLTADVHGLYLHWVQTFPSLWQQLECYFLFCYKLKLWIAVERSNYALLSKQPLANPAALGNSAVLLSGVIVSLPWESISPPVLWAPLLSAGLQRMVSEITQRQSNSPHYLPHPKTAQTLTHLSEGSLIFQLVINKNCCIKTSQAISA